MKKIGKISLDSLSNRLIIDAEPHIMSKIRKLFPSHSRGDRGTYTHKTVSLAATLTNFRDIDWIMGRYPMDCEENLTNKIRGKSEEYDDLYREISEADKDYELKVNPNSMDMTVTLRKHQISFQNMAKKVKRMLLADKMGLGKTISALSMIVDPETRPAIIVLPPTLCTQWDTVIGEIVPDMTTHVIRGFKNYELPDVDVIITSYNRLAKWQDVLHSIPFKTVIFDEIHELRATDTQKREHAKLLSTKANTVIGLSGTPIFNYGNEIWSVLDVINPDCLGTRNDFLSEWCTWDREVIEPSTLNGYLKNLGLMLRRNPEEVGLTFGDLSKTIYTIDSDLDELKKVQDVAKILALSVLSGKVGEDSRSSRELDWKLRQATGIAKAKPVAEFVKMILEEEEKIVLTGWHRDFYDIVMKELKKFNPVMFTGSESPKQKEDALDKFIKGNSRIFIISLRSGAGIDGLQKVCNTIVHGELDWSPHVHDQLNARLDRDGQVKHVQAYYLTVTDGSDPFVIQTLNVKRSQHDGLVEGKEGEIDVLDQTVDSDRIKKMAEHYLKSIGEEIPEIIEEEGLLKDVAGAIRTFKIPHNTEDEMQRALESVLPQALPDCKIEREYNLSKRSRLDFLISRGDEKIIIECKVNARKRADVYKQVRRYAEEIDVNAVVLVAPWNAVPSFIVDGTPVVVVDTSTNAL